MTRNEAMHSRIVVHDECVCLDEEQHTAWPTIATYVGVLSLRLLAGWAGRARLATGEGRRGQERRESTLGPRRGIPVGRGTDRTTDQSPEMCVCVCVCCSCSHRSSGGRRRLAGPPLVSRGRSWYHLICVIIVNDNKVVWKMWHHNPTILI